MTLTAPEGKAWRIVAGLKCDWRLWM